MMYARPVPWRVYALITLAFSLMPRNVLYACDDDSQCKGERVCNSRGHCVDADADDDSPPARTREPPMQSPAQQRPAAYCVTNFGSCPMAVQVLPGTSCFCPSAVGPIAGIAR